MMGWTQMRTSVETSVGNPHTRCLYHRANAVLLDLLAYCRAQEWSGYDPYDTLNSEFFQKYPYLNHRVPRLLLTQLFKRSIWNLRPLLRVPKTRNPKAIALFLSSFVKMDKMGILQKQSLISEMVEILANERSTGQSHFCWGYSFPWQTRSQLVARGAPNLVCTVFSANALLDAYELTHEQRCLEMAINAANYLCEVLLRKTEQGSIGFSYPTPDFPHIVHNSNLLGAALLCRVNKHHPNIAFQDIGLQVARCTAAKQNPEGAWPYGEHKTQQWIDHFHTGYILCALKSIGCEVGTREFAPSIEWGLNHYKAHFFRADGAPKYFHNRTYPIDIHCVAQSLITLSEFAYLDHTNIPLAESVLEWALQNMWDKKGFFYYQLLPTGKICTPYMRWSLAWMMLGMATLIENRTHYSN